MRTGGSLLSTASLFFHCPSNAMVDTGSTMSYTGIAIGCVSLSMAHASEAIGGAAGLRGVPYYCLHTPSVTIDTAVKAIRTADNFFHT